MDRIPEEVNVPFMLSQVCTRLGDDVGAARYMTIAQDADPRTANMIRAVQSGKSMGRIVLDATAPTRGGDTGMDDG